MTVRVGINGFGRTGRAAFRAWWQNRRDDFEIVAINRGPVHIRTHLLRHDSDYGRFPAEIVDGTDSFTVDGHEVHVFNENDPKDIPWGKANVDVVIESTGHYRTGESAGTHLHDGVKKVIISSPAKGEDWTVIMGINDEQYSAADHHVISAGSCTTNCVVVAVKVLHDAFTIERGFMTTVHSYTGDQNLVDNSHKDLRRARAAALNIIPTSSGASSAVGRIIPELAGKFDGMALRVPTPTVSLVDLTTNLRDTPSIGEINEAFLSAAGGRLKGYLAYEREELVSSDFKENPHSAIFDAPSTMLVDGGMAKTLEWYDNEWGYSCRLTDVVAMLAERGLK
ncbi:MAG: type I glyceraldehyde-3-phosphate dehydrogenase [Chloroflexi bacterium]|nr:type I glyceraldehyde-3-phosphate dehydrogenase [Chloroflexota bacterium]MDA1147741.1 type I glyceraldehyde-3-phosphate dehydrogenase [Chloroflexota bacterium]